MRRIIPLLLMAALFAACGSKVEITNHQSLITNH